MGPARCREGWQGSARQHLQPPGCPCLDGGACYSEAGDWGRGVKLREFIFLFRLEKVYNLVKENLPKKSDGQSGGQGAPKPALAPGGLLCGGLSGLGPERGVWLFQWVSFLCHPPPSPQTSA